MMVSYSSDSTKGRVLTLLRGWSGGTAQDVADALGVTVPAARRHLMDLEAAGLIQSQVEKPAGRGRPQHVFSLTTNGEHTFPKRYAQLAHDILEHVETLYGSGAILEVLSARNAKLIESWQDRICGQTLMEKLECLAGVLNEHGYEARIEIGEDGVLYLLEGNCPALEVARQYGQLCQSETELYAKLLDARVVRESQISQGASVCRYQIG